MLLYVAQYLTELYSAFNVFNYLTTRAILGALTALVLSFAFGPYLIQRLQMQRIGQQIRQVGPESHFPKAGTPTMGGALILLAIAISTVLWADLTNRFVLLALGGTLLGGLLSAGGWADSSMALTVGSRPLWVARSSHVPPRSGSGLVGG